MNTDKESKKERLKRRSKLVLKSLKIMILLLIVIGISGASYLTFKYYPEYKKMTEEANTIIENIDNKTFKRLDPTVIVRSDNSVVREFKHTPYKYIEGEDISDDIKNAFVSIEDKRFYKHKGVDLKANLRAVKALIVNNGEITQGASTITQQLVKNIFLTNEQSYERKIKEIILSIRLEDKLGKDKILEYYVNNIYFGNGAYGIETAADHYFSKTSKDLTVSEVAFLAAIPNNPTIFDPINNKENTLSRRDRIVDNMLEEEKLNESQSSEAKSQEITLNIKPKDEYVPEDFEVSYIMSSATKIVMEKEGFEFKYKFDSDEERAKYNKELQELFDDTSERIRAGGYKIESTIDPIKQTHLQEAINNGLKGFSSIDQEKGIYETQGAGATINNKTNELVAIVGGRTQDSIANTYNRAFLSHRQPGSIIKPIVNYGVEIDEGMLSSNMYNDELEPKGPKNASGRYLGRMTAREALERSVNTIPFNMMKNRGTTLAREYMAKMEFSNIVDGDANAGIAIGGFTYGATPLEITAAYATLANDGKYVKPTGIRSIEFNNESIIYLNEYSSTKVYEDGTAYLLTDMLKGVISKKHGTGNKQSLGKMPVAGKTGTTDDNKDGWFAGYTPYYTTAIWVGNDMPKSINGLYGGTYPGTIWQKYMSKIHDGLNIEDFKVPDGTRKMYLNPKTGDVSDTKKSGYTLYEIIPAHYRIKVEKEKARIAEEARIAKEKREKEERERIEREAAAERKRKAEFLEEYGIEEDVELKNRETATANVNLALSMNINSEEDYYKARDLLNLANNSLDELRVEEYKNELQQRINNGYPALDEKLANMYVRQEEERIRLEEEAEAARLAEIERQRQAEEARLQAIEDARIQAEEEAKQAIQDELDRQEKERQDKLAREQKEKEEADKKAEEEKNNSN